MNIGEKIKNLRKSNNMSQEELAEKLCVSRQSISQWEQNSTQPTLDNLIAISKLFNVSLDEIVKEQESEAIRQTPISNSEPESAPVFNQKRHKRIMRTFGILAVINFLALPYGIALVNYEDANFTVKSILIRLIYLIIPIVSIAFCIHFEKQGYKNRLLFATSIISIIFISLSIIPSMTMRLSMQDKNYPQIKQRINNTLEIELPQDTDTIKTFFNDKSGKKIYITFTDKQVEEFEKKLSSNNKWCKPLSTKNTALLPVWANNSEDDYAIIYNATLGELNTFPTQTSTYHFLYVEYNAENNTMYIIEYDKKIII